MSDLMLEMAGEATNVTHIGGIFHNTEGRSEYVS
jgi:hypothetical protein